MTSISGIEVFLAIVRHGSLTGAARALGVGTPAVSHRLKSLERDIGADLLTRTTRSLDLTPAGRALLAGAGPALEEIAAAVENARAAGKSTVGALRLTIPWSAFKIVIAPALAGFQQTYPDIRLEFSFDERLVDIVHDGFHAGFRLGDQLAEGMIATRLTPDLVGAYSASPVYLDRHGRPSHPLDLFDHHCIRYRYGSANRIADWRFSIDGRETSIDPPPRLIFDNFRAVVRAAIDSHGIGWSLRAAIEDHLAAGTLETVLDSHLISHPPFYIFYPEQHRRLEPLRLLIDFLKSQKRKGT